MSGLGSSRLPLVALHEIAIAVITNVIPLQPRIAIFHAQEAESTDAKVDRFYPASQRHERRSVERSRECICSGN